VRWIERQPRDEPSYGEKQAGDRESTLVALFAGPYACLAWLHDTALVPISSTTLSVSIDVLAIVWIAAIGYRLQRATVWPNASLHALFDRLRSLIRGPRPAPADRPVPSATRNR
jgi:hypothetical protein